MIDTIILNVLTGSKLKGLSDENSDFDTRGIFVEPLRKKLNPFRQSPSYERNYKQYDTTLNQLVDYDLWEITYYANLLKNGNPLILTMLYSPIVLINSESGKLLVDNRQNLISPSVINGVFQFCDIKLRQAEREFAKNSILWRKYFLHIFSTIDEISQILQTGNIEYPLKNELLYDIKYNNKYEYYQLIELYKNMRNRMKSDIYAFSFDTNWLLEFTYSAYIKEI